jgi:2-oxoisovalerate dehydrogenase E1 component
MDQPQDFNEMELKEALSDAPMEQLTEHEQVPTGGETDAKQPTPTSGIEGDFDVQPLTPDDFSEEELMRVYRTMLTARRLDEKMLTLLKQGKGFFHIGCSGHEAAQAALGLYAKPGHDWFSMYYRDLCMTLMLGMTPRDTMLAHMAKADDPSSGGRQMSEHFGHRQLQILSTSSAVGAQYLPAVGFGLGIQRQGSDAFAYASCGDGATSQGAFHEALNWAARSGAPTLFFVQDNKYAISVPVADQTAGGSAYGFGAGYKGLTRARFDGTDFFKSAAIARAAIDHLRAGKGPVLLVADVVRLLPHSSSDNHTKYRTPEELDADQTIDPIARFEATLVEHGLLTDDKVQELREEVRKEVDEAAVWASDQPDPAPETATRHVFYEGEDHNEYFASEPSGDPLVMVDAVNQAMREEMERDDRILVYGEDVAGGKGGVFTATRDLTDLFGKERCFNSPLAENSIIGTAVGLAAMGFKPVVEIQFADYIWPAMQPLRNQVAPMRYRSNNSWACPMVIRVPCGGYIHGGLCHSQNIEAIFGHMPGFKIALPSNAADAKGLLKTAIRGHDPVLFLEHKAMYRMAAARTPTPDADYLVPFGKAAIAREGTDLTIVTYGMMVHKSLNVAKQLEKEGVSAEVIDLRTIVPVDMETVLASVRKTNRALVVYEDHEFMGFGSEIAAQLASKAFADLDAPVERVAGAFTYIPFAAPLEEVVLPQDDDVLEAARRVLSF